MPIPRKGFCAGEGGGVREVCDRPAVDAGGKAYPLVLDVVKGVRTKMDWERDDVVHDISVGKYLDAEHFGVLPVEVESFATTTRGKFGRQHMARKIEDM